MNKTIYKQLDSKWSSLPYPTKKSSFGGNGCGCCACVHIAIEQTAKKSWTPATLRPWMVSKGFAVAGKGTLWSGITETLKYIGHKNVVWIKRNDPMSKAWAELNKGNRIGVLLVDNSRTPNGTVWTASGHYVAFTDYKVVNGQHKFYIKDSGARNHDGWYTYEKSIKGALPQLWIVERIKETPVKKKTVDELAKEVIDGKWGNGDERVSKLKAAGYDPNAVQKKVNELLAKKAEPSLPKWVQNANAWARKIAADNRYHYNMWEQNVAQSHKCPICSKLNYNKDPDHFGWNCIGFGAAVWHHGGGLKNICKCGWISGPHGSGDKLLSLSYNDALALAKKSTGLNDIELIRNKNGIPKSEWKGGDICLKFVGDVFNHVFYYTGDKTIIDSTRIYNDKSKWTKAVIANQIKERSWDNYSAKVIIRYKGK